MFRSKVNSLGESVWSVLRKKGKLRCRGRICSKSKVLSLEWPLLVTPPIHCYCSRYRIWRVSWSVCLSVAHKRALCQHGWTDRNAVWDLDYVGPKEPRNGWGPGSFQEKWQIFGAPCSQLWNTGNIRRGLMLYGRWQQRCGLLLSVLQQLV